ncbi:MAG: carbohydrate binding domain-containing protein [Planctomycetota bacterium]
MAQHYEEPEDDTFTSFNADNGEATPGNRSKFDDVDDYFGWNASPPQRIDGTDIDSAVGWTRGVVVTRADPTTFATVSTETGLKRIEVFVQSPSGDVSTMVALRGRAGLPDNAENPSTYTSWMEIELQAGADGKSTYRTSANLMNQPSYIAPNLLTNGGFEDGVDPWQPDAGVSLSVNTSDVPSGVNSLDVTGVTLFVKEGVYQQIDASQITNGTTYSVCADVYVNFHTGTLVSGHLYLVTSDGDVLIRSNEVWCYQSWTEFCATIEADWTGELQAAYFGVHVWGVDMRLDDVSLRQVY